MIHGKKTRKPFIVGVGASAGGLEALQIFFQKFPEDSGLSFVVIQHLSTDHKSMMLDLQDSEEKCIQALNQQTRKQK